jgi:hypothetical protein
MARVAHPKARAVSGVRNRTGSRGIKAAAVREFKLSAEQRRRLLVQERTPAVS